MEPSPGGLKLSSPHLKGTLTGMGDWSRGEVIRDIKTKPTARRLDKKFEEGTIIKGKKGQNRGKIRDGRVNSCPLYHMPNEGRPGRQAEAWAQDAGKKGNLQLKKGGKGVLTGQLSLGGRHGRS